MDSLSTTAGKGPDMEEAMAMFRKGGIDAEQLHGLLSKTFGNQVKGKSAEDNAL